MFSPSGVLQRLTLRGRLGGLLPLCCVASLQAGPLQQTFADWQITCNNLNACEARSFPSSHGLVMQLTRDAGPNDRAQLSILNGTRDSGERPDNGLPDSLLLDGKPLKPDLTRWQVSERDWSVTDAPAIAAFLQQVKDAGELRLPGRPQAVISLRGLQAALLRMDEVQGRVNHRSAWSARGKGSSDDLPAAPAAPVVPAASHPAPALSSRETRQLLDYASWQLDNDFCSLDPQWRESQVGPLSGDKALLLVSCERGAYNVIWLAFEVSRRPPFAARPLTLTLPFAPSGQAGRRQELVNAGFDAVNGELLTISKIREQGDCGVATRWKYDGREFRLVEYRQQSQCDGPDSREPWPALWVTQQADTSAAGSVQLVVEGQ